jgi:hypothetical protein
VMYPSRESSSIFLNDRFQEFPCVSESDISAAMEEIQVSSKAFTF